GPRSPGTELPAYQPASRNPGGGTSRAPSGFNPRSTIGADTPIAGMITLTGLPPARGLTLGGGVTVGRDVPWPMRSVDTGGRARAGPRCHPARDPISSAAPTETTNEAPIGGPGRRWRPPIHRRIRGRRAPFRSAREAG